MPTFGSGDDFVWIGGPDEGLWLLIMVGDEAVDGGLQVDDAFEDAALETTLGEDGEEALDGVEPAGRGRREVERPAGVTAQPFDHLGVLVDGVVVEDGMNGLAGRDLALDGIEEADELLMAVALHAATDDLAFQHVEGGEQGGRAVSLVIMGHGPGPALLHRQPRLGAVQRLDLALLIDAEHHGVGGRINIQADDVADLGGEPGIIGELEGADAVRCQAMGLPDALHRGQADTGDPGHHPAGPVGGLAGRLAQGQGDDPLGDLVGQPLDTRGAGLVAQQAIDAFIHEAFLPAPDGRLADPRRTHDRRRAKPVRRPQNDPGAPDVLLGAVAVIDDRSQALAINRAQVDSDASAHPADSHGRSSLGNPAQDSYVGINPLAAGRSNCQGTVMAWRERAEAMARGGLTSRTQ